MKEDIINLRSETRPEAVVELPSSTPMKVDDESLESLTEQELRLMVRDKFYQLEYMEGKMGDKDKEVKKIAERMLGI